MPGLSSRNPVPGYGNIGKVHIRFKPKPKKKPYYGLVLFSFCLLLLAFSWMWTDKWKREVIILPVFRFIVGSIDSFRLPSPQASSHSPGRDVKVEMDTLGQPKISANSINDVLFGQGYVHAKYRLFQMDLLRHKAHGHLSSWEGERGLESDLISRAFNISQLARADLVAQNPTELSYLQSFADGVNAYIAEKAPLPVEFSLLGLEEVQTWSPLDSLALVRYHSVLLSELWELELTRYMVDIIPEAEGLTNTLLPSLRGLAGDRQEGGGGAVHVIPTASSSSSWILRSQIEGTFPLHSTAIVSEVHTHFCLCTCVF